MKKFEIGKIYRERLYMGVEKMGVEIKVVKRTDKTVTFIYTKPNWWEDDITKEYEKKISDMGQGEVIYFGSVWASPTFYPEPVEEITETAEVS